ncbi:MAG: sugar phosphate isomerase/epimerase [Calditrichaeota bacterium]|nr:sugar phosphate isomerase/epimerase [Calditrichota bacterium]
MDRKKFRVGIDNYSLFPLKLKPLELLQWAKENGAEGVSFSGLEPENLKLIDDGYLRDLRDFAGENNLYLEWGGASHIPRDMTSWAKNDVFSINKKAAEQAEKLGVRVVRSCSGGLMRWKDDSPSTETLLKETAEALKAQKQMLMDHNVILAIETHFEFTTHEILRIFEYCDTEPGEYLGICLDTMNLLTMLENPVWATERVLPWIVSTHIKDGGLLPTKEGLRSFVAEVGRGAIYFSKILKRLSQLSWDVNLNIEDHGGDFALPIFDPFFLSKFPDLTTAELASLLEIAEISRQKIESGECAVLDRADWPAVCEERVKRDIIQLKQIKEEIE